LYYPRSGPADAGAAGGQAIETKSLGLWVGGLGAVK